MVALALGGADAAGQALAVQDELQDFVIDAVDLGAQGGEGQIGGGGLRFTRRDDGELGHGTYSFLNSNDLLRAR